MPHPGPTGALVTPGVDGLVAVGVFGLVGDTTACGGMRNVWPGYGN